MPLFSVHRSKESSNYATACHHRIDIINELILLHKDLTRLNNSSNDVLKNINEQQLNELKKAIINYNTNQIRNSIKMKKILTALLNNNTCFPDLKYYSQWKKQMKFSDSKVKNSNAKLVYGSDEQLDPSLVMLTCIFFCPLLPLFILWLSLYFIISRIQEKIDIFGFEPELPEQGFFVDNEAFKVQQPEIPEARVVVDGEVNHNEVVVAQYY